MFPVVIQVCLNYCFVWLKGCDHEKQHAFLFYLKEQAYDNSLNFIPALRAYQHTRARTHTKTSTRAHKRMHAHAHTHTRKRKDKGTDEVSNLPMTSPLKNKERTGTEPFNSMLAFK